MAVLDIQIVSTSIVEIQSSLNLERSSLSWIQTAYLIAEIIAISVTGIATRALGVRILFSSSIAIFTIASLGCGFSNNFSSLIAFRTLQGFSGGVLIPIVFTSVFLFFEHKDQAIPTTIAGVLAVLAPTLGPLIGGWITSNYGWPWLFFVNLPFGLFAIITSLLFLDKEIIQLKLIKNFDAISLLLLSICLASLEIGLKEAPLRGWSSATSLSLFLASFLSFCLV